MPKKKPIIEMDLVELFCDAKNNLMKVYLGKDSAKFALPMQEALRRLSGKEEWTASQCVAFYKSVIHTFVHDQRELQFIMQMSGFYKGFETKRLLKDRRVLFATSDLRDDPLFESWEETNSDSRERDIIASAVSALTRSLDAGTHQIDNETGEVIASDHEQVPVYDAHTQNEPLPTNTTFRPAIDHGNNNGPEQASTLSGKDKYPRRWGKSALERTPEFQKALNREMWRFIIFLIIVLVLTAIILAFLLPKIFKGRFSRDTTIPGNPSTTAVEAIVTDSPEILQNIDD